MAITRGNFSTGGQDDTDTMPFEFSHSIATGANFLLVAFTVPAEGGATVGVAGVKFAGKSMTLVANELSPASASRECEIWVYRLNDPAVGLQTVSIDITTMEDIGGLAVDYLGVYTPSPLDGTPQTVSATSTPAAGVHATDIMTSTLMNAMVVAFPGYFSTSSPAVIGGAVSSQAEFGKNQNPNGLTFLLGGDIIKVNPGAQTMEWASPPNQDFLSDHAMITLALNGSPLPPTPTAPDETQLGSLTIIYTNSLGQMVDLSQSLDTASCFIETKDLDLGLVDMEKFLQRIFLEIDKIEDSPNLQFIIKTRQRLSDPLVSHPAFSLSDMTVNTMPVRIPGARFFRLRIEDLGISAIWGLSRIELFGYPGGSRQ